MYITIPDMAIPLASTGVTIWATQGNASWVLYLFVFCAMFALVGVVLAFRRILPVPAFVQGFAEKRRQDRLREARLWRQLRR